MANSQALSTTFQTYMENPLLWPILEVLKRQSSGWKVHTLAAHLSEQGLIPVLDSAADKDLFKRNFLIMNALYQLQEILYPKNWLQVEAMDIALLPVFSHSHYAIDPDDPLRDYYSRWEHYEVSEGEVKRLLNEFWTRYQRFVGGDDIKTLDRSQALRLFELPADASSFEIRKTWRRLALRWHPDRDNGNAAQFRILCAAWNVLRHEH
ncbi:DNA-J related domain-containing protein [Vibrio metschnikovii]|uniref:DnaJ domain-containing protein n=1 Tax=Vibrio metschnikovii TaxID=28172 RepID=A0A9X0R7E3_VIBME|nr:DNA-J related domain-containing protein [Vibrio metschnikovii]EKO3659394.1 DnaJ domain-containing protein [Vibrio metschnikovii]MBC3619024.1 DnaJ domain-containing protein [Vibrio metschnikovii]MBC5832859.1 DnaJ domain-containing protein [Vibrio metschnikovii]MBC5850298.1 DnaJ domain-containing protein [Vibrio metschnikovii]MDA3138494.1 DnaJ domain-containing protein [Vibrio metschnikovii]